MIEKYKEIVKKELLSGIDGLDIDSLFIARDLILESEKYGGRVHITGIGKPGHVAAYVASLLSSTGTCAYELHGTEAVHGSSGQVKAGDVVIAISNSGQTTELLATVHTLIKNGAKIIACTRNCESELAKVSQVCLVAKCDEEGGPLNKAPRSSVLMEMIVLQALSILLQEAKQLDLKTYVSFHPGGSLGQMGREELNR